MKRETPSPQLRQTSVDLHCIQDYTVQDTQYPIFLDSNSNPVTEGTNHCIVLCARLAFALKSTLLLKHHDIHLQ